MARALGRQRVFDTDRRIRLGIWGLGRGMSFFSTCQFLNIDVVAGCDFNAHMRANFLASCPKAFVTADADAFLAQDFDAVLLATFCPAHADDAIRCLRAGKHVLSEVTAFHTLAEGVRLVEEVEQRGRVYHLAENYPYSAANMWLASRWREGLFGELMYAEYEYVHECRSLAYTYIDGQPVQPGHQPHHWRSWQDFHYYCTHSLGPAMVITGTRPTRVEAFACTPRLAGYLNTGDGLGMGTMSPSLIHMSNGGVVRNLMGAATNDSHQQRIWGTLGAYEIGHDGVKLRLGASGQSPLLNVNPVWEGLGELAANTGHGGGDFWTLYYFAREILTGEKGPFDIYGAADVTIPGIQALRSSLEGGKPMEVPDFRNPAERARYRADDWEQERYPVARGVFGGHTPVGPAAHFSTTMKGMVEYAPVYRAYADWKKVRSALARPEEFRPVAARLLDGYEKLTAAYRDARAIVDAQPGTDGARVLAEMLDLGGEQQVLAPGFLPALKQEVATLKRKFGDGWAAMPVFAASPLLADRTRIGAVAYPGREIAFSAVTYDSAGGYCDLRDRYAGRKNHDGLIYARGIYRAAKAGAGKLRLNADGPFKLFVNGREMACDPKATNPMSDHSLTLPVVWEKGRNEVLLALRTNRGQAWGFMAAALAAKAREG